MHTQIRLRICFLKLPRWEPGYNCVVCCREVLCFLAYREDLLVTANQEHWGWGKIQGWMCEQTEQVLNLSLEMTSWGTYQAVELQSEGAQPPCSLSALWSCPPGSKPWRNNQVPWALLLSGVPSDSLEPSRSLRRSMTRTTLCQMTLDHKS